MQTCSLPFGLMIMPNEYLLARHLLFVMKIDDEYTCISDMKHYLLKITNK
jgi:hypothetical protein